MLSRRAVLAGATLAGVNHPARSSNYPSQPIKIVVPSAAGGGSDIVARHLGDRMRADFGVPVVVENRPGAGGNIGAEYLKSAPPDGYTIMVSAAAIAIAPAVNATLPFDVIRDFTPITLISDSPLLIVTRKDAPYQTMGDVTAAAKAGSVNFASFGVGSPSHLIGEVINQAAGIKMVHVPYRGAAPALPDLLAGRTSIGILDAFTTQSLVANGELRPLAATGPRRLKAYPNVPALSETGTPFDTVGWQGVFAPAGLPVAVAGRLNAGINAILSRPDMIAIIETGGSIPVVPPTNLEEWRARFAGDVAAWGKVARAAGVTVQ